MSAQHQNTYPKLHNAMWPGLVGKGSPGAEPCIDLDTMLDLTARAEVDGIRFDGVDLFLFAPHINIDVDDDGIKALADKIRSRGFEVGSVVAPVWPPTGGGSAMGGEEERKRFVEQVRKACRLAQKLRQLGVRPHGIVRIDSACSVTDWDREPTGNQQKIAQTFREACDVAEGFGERLAAEGEICWGGMHSWKRMLDLLQRVDRPKTLGFQADMAHTLLYVLGYNAAEDAILPADWDWSEPARLDQALKTLTDALRPWTIDFHVAQNDATVKGSGTHDKTGHHCLPNDPNGKLSIIHHAGFWLRGENGQPIKTIQHVCWDGCMFPNAVMGEGETWNAILRTLIAVRDAYGWTEAAPQPVRATEPFSLETEEPPGASTAAQPKKRAKHRTRKKPTAVRSRGKPGKRARTSGSSRKSVKTSARKSTGIRGKSRRITTRRNVARPKRVTPKKRRAVRRR